MAAAEEFAKTAFDAIANNRPSDPAGNRQPQTSRCVRRFTGKSDNHKKTAGAPASAVKYPLVFGTSGEPHPAGEALAPRRQRHPLTVRRWRPFARRRARILRPFLVAIRARKPCLFTRRRLLGWKVLFMTLPQFTFQGRGIEPSPSAHVKGFGLHIPSGKAETEARRSSLIHWGSWLTVSSESAARAARTRLWDRSQEKNFSGEQLPPSKRPAGRIRVIIS